MSTNWKAGDRAFCVDDSRGKLRSGATTPLSDYPQGPLKKGTIYLVEGVRVKDGNTGLFLAGKNCLTFITREPKPFFAHRFRKVVPMCDRNEREQTELRPHEGFWQKRGDL